MRQEKYLLETERLFLREMVKEDISALRKILQDKEVMMAYEHAFCEEEAWEWFFKQKSRYIEEGFGLWAVIEKQTKQMIGQCGLTMQEYNGKKVPEIGYLFQKQFWHQGFAIEAAKACKEYAFSVEKMEEVFSIIRDNNFASQKVAKRNGMTLCGRQMKYYYNMEMPHLVFSVKRKS